MQMFCIKANLGPINRLVHKCYKISYINLIYLE